MENTVTAAPAQKAPKLTGVYVLLSIILGLMLISGGIIAVGVISTISEFTGGFFEKTAENDVVIAENYTILSTEKLSDAYLAGDLSALSDEEKETVETAAEILENLVTKDMTDYEKEKAVYDWMCENIGHDDRALSVIVTDAQKLAEPSGVLKSRKAVCVGYATTFRLFMQMLDIPCMVVHNTEGYHSWNVVELEDHWYITDVYTDTGDLNYTHFNITDTMMANSGNTWDTDYFPAADSLDYNPLYQEAVSCKTIYEFPALVRAAIDEGRSIVSVRLPADMPDEEYTIASRIVSDTYDYIFANSICPDKIVSYDFIQMEDCSLAYMVFGESADSIDQEEQERISDAIDQALGDLAYSWEDEETYDDYEIVYAEENA